MDALTVVVFVGFVLSIMQGALFGWIVLRIAAHGWRLERLEHDVNARLGRLEAAIDALARSRGTP